MKKYILILLLPLVALVCQAQEMGDKGGKHKFDPVAFEQMLEKFVVQKSGMTQEEADKFLPIYREMRKKQLAIMGEKRKAFKKRPQTEEECENAIKTCDNSEINMKRLEQTYHNRMLKVLPASKLIRVIYAEERFYKEAFNKMRARQNAPARK